MTTSPMTEKGFTFHPAPEIHQRLEILSKETNRPVSFYINTLLEEHLDKIEHAYMLKRNAELARAGQLQTRSLEDIAKDLEL